MIDDQTNHTNAGFRIQGMRVVTCERLIQRLSGLVPAPLRSKGPQEKINSLFHKRSARLSTLFSAAGERASVQQYSRRSAGPLFVNCHTGMAFPVMNLPEYKGRGRQEDIQGSTSAAGAGCRERRPEATWMRRKQRTSVTA